MGEAGVSMPSKNCGACKREIPAIAKFCPYCGVQVVPAASFKIPVFIERPRSHHKNTAFVRVGVYVDNELVDELQDDGWTRKFLDVGNHRITFEARAWGRFPEYMGTSFSDGQELRLTEGVRQVSITVGVRFSPFGPAVCEVQDVHYDW